MKALLLKCLFIGTRYISFFFFAQVIHHNPLFFPWTKVSVWITMQSRYWSPKRPSIRVSFLLGPNLQSSGPDSDHRESERRLIDVEIIIGERSRNKSKNHVKFLAVMTFNHATTTTKKNNAQRFWMTHVVIYSLSFDGIYVCMRDFVWTTRSRQNPLLPPLLSKNSRPLE